MTETQVKPLKTVGPKTLPEEPLHCCVGVEMIIFTKLGFHPWLVPIDIQTRFVDTAVWQGTLKDTLE